MSQEMVGATGDALQVLVHDHRRVDQLYDDPGLSENFEKLKGEVRHHVEEEENELFPQLRSTLGEHRLMEVGQQLAEAKRRAPTRPHPHAPDTPPASVAAGPVAAVVDKARDAVRDAARDERG